MVASPITQHWALKSNELFNALLTTSLSLTFSLSSLWRWRHVSNSRPVNLFIIAIINGPWLNTTHTPNPTVHSNTCHKGLFTNPFSVLPMISDQQLKTGLFTVTFKLARPPKRPNEKWKTGKANCCRLSEHSVKEKEKTTFTCSCYNPARHLQCFCQCHGRLPSR